MFKKLLSNLPYNPSLLGQVSFYAKRLHREEALRRLGLVFIVLSFVVQMFAFVSMPEPTLAESSNDIIRGGFSSKNEAVGYCRDSARDFDNILAHYGITCAMLESASTSTVTVRSTDYGKQLQSMGRNQQGAVIRRTGKPTNEYPVDIKNAGRFWMRNLWAWDSGASSSYKMLRINMPNSTPIFIMYNCGNIVTVGKKEPKVPVKQIACSDLLMSVPNRSNVKRGTIVSMRGRATAKNAPPGERVNMHYDVINAANGQPYTGQKRADGVLITNGVAQDGTPRSVKMDKVGSYRLVLTVRYDSGTKVASGSQTGNCVKYITVEEPDICTDIPGTQTNENECKPCEEAESEDDVVPCTVKSKAARNDTQNTENADGTVAQPGDVITYTLSVKNTGLLKAENFVIEENVADILDYADITDFHGGKLEGVMVRWPAQDINPNQTISKQLEITVKKPVPTTPVSASDPARFDLNMNNVYGNAINIGIPGNIVKITETTTKTLPNTGPGETLAAVIGLTMFVSYFFARTRLFAKELDIVTADYAAGGGY